MWGKTAVLFALLALMSGIWSVLIDGEGGSTLTWSLRLRGIADALGQLAPFIALLSVLVEPVQVRRWAYTAFVVTALAVSLSALGAANEQTAVVDTASPTTVAPTAPAAPTAPPGS